MTLDRVRATAQIDSNRENRPLVILNLNRVGRALYVIRDVAFRYGGDYVETVYPDAWRGK